MGKTNTTSFFRQGTNKLDIIVREPDIDPFTRKKDLWLDLIKEADLGTQLKPFIEQQKEFKVFKTLDDNVLCIIGVKTENNYHIYVLGPVLGKGAEGSVYLAWDLLKSSLVVVKAIKPNGQPEVFVHPEKNALLAIDRLLGHYVDNPKYDDHRTEYLFIPYYEGGNCIGLMYDLNPAFGKEDARHYTGKKKLPVALILDIAEKALLELKLFEERGVIHRDINPFNIICSTLELGGVLLVQLLRIVDFGNALTGDAHVSQPIAGTFGYIAPEIDVTVRRKKQKFKNHRHDFSSDMFSLGVFLAELVTTSNFQEYRIKKMAEIAEKEQFSRPMTLEEIKLGMPDIFAPLTDEMESEKQALIHLIRALLDENPEKRRPIKAALHALQGIRNGQGLFRRTSSKLFLNLGLLVASNSSGPGSPRPSAADELIQRSSPLSARRQHVVMPHGDDAKAEEPTGSPLISRKRSGSFKTELQVTHTGTSVGEDIHPVRALARQASGFFEKVRDQLTPSHPDESEKPTFPLILE